MLILPCRASPATADQQSFAPLSAVRSTKSHGSPESRPRAVRQELLIPTLPITGLQDGPPPPSTGCGHGTDAVRLGRSNNQPQARRGGAWQSSPTSLYPQGLAVTLHICYRWLAIVFLEEKTALRPRNSRPLAAVCRTKVTKADSGVGVVPSIANLRGRTRSQRA